MPWNPREGLGGQPVKPPLGTGLGMQTGGIGELKQYDPSLRQRYTDLMMDALMGMGVGAPKARHYAYGLMGLGDMTPVGALTAADDVKRAYNRGSYGEAGLGLAMFLGPGAKTANKAALKIAEDMLSKGETREAIHKATGWFKGADKKWRFEIPDDSSHLWSSARSDINDGNTRKLGAPGTFSHSALFEAYPNLKNVKLNNRVQADNLGTSYPALDHQLAGTIALKNRFPPDMNKTLHHEIQHQVQDIEGFAKGGQPTDFSDYEKQLYDNAWTVRSRMDNLGESAQEAAEYIGKSAGIEPDILANLARSHSGPELSAKRREASPFQQYARLAGEVEARNVSERINMTAAQRRETPPWMTQDVPDDQQIVRHR